MIANGNRIPLHEATTRRMLICVDLFSLATFSGSCRAIAGMGDRRALLHLTQSLLEVLQEDENQWRNMAAAAMGVNPPMMMPPKKAASRPMLRPPGPAMPMPYMPHMIAGPMAAPMPRPTMTVTPVIEEPPDSTRGIPAAAPMSPWYPRDSPGLPWRGFIPTRAGVISGLPGAMAKVHRIFMVIHLVITW